MSFVKVTLVLKALLTLAVMLPNFAFAQNKEFYCMEFYNGYREINYWAKKVVSVWDYEYNSGDASYLNLTHDVSDEFIDETDRELVVHFDQEFLNHVQGSLPFHDTEAGRDDRSNKALREYGTNEHFYEIFQAQEEARRNALYGPNPGAIYCHIRIERREFPVLYEMECTVVANTPLINRGGITGKKLGYSTPEHILGELRNSISEQLQSLGQTIEVIRNCP